MVNFCRDNPGVAVGLLAVMGTVIGALVVTIVGLLKGWWQHNEGGIDALWTAIKDLRERQGVLRETMPLEYVRVSALEDLKKTWRELAWDLRAFMDSCRKGECPTAHQLKRIGEK